MKPRRKSDILRIRRVSLDTLALEFFNEAGYYTIKRGFHGSFIAYRTTSIEPKAPLHEELMLVCCLKQDQKLDRVRALLHQKLKAAGIEVRIIRPSDVTGILPQEDCQLVNGPGHPHLRPIGTVFSEPPLRKRFLSLSTTMTAAQEGLREVWRRCLVAGCIPATPHKSGFYLMRALDFLRWALVDRGVEASTKDVAYLLGRHRTKNGISGYAFNKQPFKLNPNSNVSNYYFIPPLETCRRLYLHKVNAAYQFPAIPNNWHQVIVPTRAGTQRAAEFEEKHGPLPGTSEWREEHTSRDPMG